MNIFNSDLCLLDLAILALDVSFLSAQSCLVSAIADLSMFISPH
jgi:hypothetical protein